jgi:molybdopterin molybdotransferase
VGLIPLEAARARVLAGCRPLRPHVVPLDDALGCVTSVATTAAEAVPPFANTAMDGFAVRAADTASAPVTLKVIGTLAAGADPTGVRVDPGQAVRIMTGAPIPEGADAIVMVELTTPFGDGAGATGGIGVGAEGANGTAVVVTRPAQAGDHIRRAGEDIAVGQTVVEAGTALRPGHLGVLASLGCTDISVIPQARVGVLSTGDELVDGPGLLRPGQIRDSNRHALLALVRELGCVPLDLGLVGDDEAAIARVITEGLAHADALITSGGVSVGDFDHVKTVLDRLGQMHWMQVAIKPAKPLAFGVVGGKPVFGLPGNPVSSMVSFEVFARPGLRQMMGFGSFDLDRPKVHAVADEDLRRRPDGKTHFMRVIGGPGDDGRIHVRSAGGQGSHLLSAMALANALAIVPDGEGVEAGQTVLTMML